MYIQSNKAILFIQDSFSATNKAFNIKAWKQNQPVRCSDTDVIKAKEHQLAPPNHLFEYIQKQAVEDAKKCDYKTDAYKATVLGYMRKNISPNDSKLISMFNSMLMNAKYTGKASSYFPVLGFAGFTAIFRRQSVWSLYVYLKWQWRAVAFVFLTTKRRLACTPNKGEIQLSWWRKCCFV